MSDQDDPFWPPPPGELESIVIGEVPFVLLQVVQGPIPTRDTLVPYTVEVHAGGGVALEGVPHLLRTVLEALEVQDMGIMPDGTLVRRIEAPPGAPERPDPPG